MFACVFFCEGLAGSFLSLGGRFCTFGAALNDLFAVKNSGVMLWGDVAVSRFEGVNKSCFHHCDF